MYKYHRGKQWVQLRNLAQLTRDAKNITHIYYAEIFRENNENGGLLIARNKTGALYVEEFNSFSVMINHYGIEKRFYNAIPTYGISTEIENKILQSEKWKIDPETLRKIVEDYG
jgi:hypothetical protein